MQFRIKRIYDKPAATDGVRVLVDRLWPRGLSKAEARVDIWAKQLAPSHELRKWFGHDERKFHEFERRFRAELSEKAADVERLLAEIGGQAVTLVYAAKNPQCNNAVVLQQWLQRAVDQLS